MTSNTYFSYFYTHTNAQAHTATFLCICMLQKEDRDTAYAEAYLNKVKVAMQKDPGTYTQFMGLLRQFETSQLSPVEVGCSGCEVLTVFIGLSISLSLSLSLCVCE